VEFLTGFPAAPANNRIDSCRLFVKKNYRTSQVWTKGWLYFWFDEQISNADPDPWWWAQSSIPSPPGQDLSLVRPALLR